MKFEAVVYQSVFNPSFNKTIHIRNVLKTYPKKPTDAEIQRLALESQTFDKIKVERK